MYARVVNEIELCIFIIRVLHTVDIRIYEIQKHTVRIAGKLDG